jgi:hypothetical protein
VSRKTLGIVGKEMHFLRFVMPLFAAALLLPGATLYSPTVHAHPDGQETAPEKPAFHYVCPMHEDVTSKKPGKCPKCKMKLEKKKVKEPAKPADQ